MTVKTSVVALLFVVATWAPFKNLSANNITSVPFFSQKELPWTEEESQKMTAEFDEIFEEVLEQVEESFGDILDEFGEMDELDITIEDLESITNDPSIKTEPSWSDKAKLAWMFIKFETEKTKQHIKEHPEDYVVSGIIATNLIIAGTLWWLLLQEKP
ncbi:hypothetical protein K2W90_02205 [Candidatus Babeliales bacterium]|nr:hypothetical protein [Candidatus Babeliales bacterium]